MRKIVCDGCGVEEHIGVYKDGNSIESFSLTSTDKDEWPHSKSELCKDCLKDVKERMNAIHIEMKVLDKPVKELSDIKSLVNSISEKISEGSGTFGDEVEDLAKIFDFVLNLED